MIIEERIYSLHIGAAAEYLRLYEAEGLAVQRPILGRMVGYFSSEIGPLHQLIHLWAYKDLAERSERRAKLVADPRWKAYVPKIRPFMISQENKILIPAAFSPWAKDDPALDMASPEYTSL
ncbi:NIPSNAP family protein [Candidatus Halocynthiibacter alkanivorans]|jgi:NIPSNAP|uniref:NIPSNAP family protein n=1 Tax=Candidatus Halocynthiibacter alkanivorans TaxID=2267619 RepID=UPI000DF1FB0F|nr:NIPSNAP family protein [Candidatus Halocynthiibacter alkanivorans]